MSQESPSPAEFYTSLLPEQFNRALREQQRHAESAQRVLEGMQGVNATIRVDVSGETFYLNIEAGALTPGDQPAHAPVLTLVQEPADFQRLIRDAGDSALGFLGGLSGLSGDMKLTKDRLTALGGVAGSLQFQVTGDDGFCLLTVFGDGPIPEKPTTTIRIDPSVYEDLQNGVIDAQNAFMTGKIEVEGDMQLAMQVALAAMAPD